MLRKLLSLTILLCLVALPMPCWAGSYLDRAALMLETSATERAFARARLHDKELLAVVHEIAEARRDAAHRMLVPDAVVSAHPHLLLALESTERAFAAALDRQLGRAVELLARASTEDATFRALIAQMGYSMPRTSTRR